jgi:hypothetical protein
MALLTLEDIKNEVLGHGFSAQNYAARIDNWANEAQQKIYRKADLQENIRSIEIETESDIDSYALPSDYQRLISVLYDENSAGISGANLYPIETVKELDEIDKELGTPTRYFITYLPDQNNRFILFRPYPNTNYKIILRYRGNPSMLSGTDTPQIPVDYIYLIVEYCLYKAYLAEGDIEMSNTHKAIFDKDLIQFVGDVQSDRQDGPTQVEGAWPGYE